MQQFNMHTGPEDWELATELPICGGSTRNKGGGRVMTTRLKHPGEIQELSEVTTWLVLQNKESSNTPRDQYNNFMDPLDQKIHDHLRDSHTRWVVARDKTDQQDREDAITADWHAKEARGIDKIGIKMERWVKKQNMVIQMGILWKTAATIIQGGSCCAGCGQLKTDGEFLPCTRQMDTEESDPLNPDEHYACHMEGYVYVTQGL